MTPCISEEASENNAVCFFTEDEHWGKCRIHAYRDYFAKWLDDTSTDVTHTVQVLFRKDKPVHPAETGSHAALQPSRPDFIHEARTNFDEDLDVFIGIVVGDNNMRSRKAVKLEVLDDTGRMKSLVSGGHQLAVDLQWERPEFDRDEAVWSFIAEGTFYCRIMLKFLFSFFNVFSPIPFLHLLFDMHMLFPGIVRPDGSIIWTDRHDIRLDAFETHLNGLGTRLDGHTARLNGLGGRLDGHPARLNDLGTRLDTYDVLGFWSGCSGDWSRWVLEKSGHFYDAKFRLLQTTLHRTKDAQCFYATNGRGLSCFPVGEIAPLWGTVHPSFCVESSVAAEISRLDPYFRLLNVLDIGSATLSRPSRRTQKSLNKWQSTYEHTVEMSRLFENPSRPVPRTSRPVCNRSARPVQLSYQKPSTSRHSSRASQQSTSTSKHRRKTSNPQPVQSEQCLNKSQVGLDEYHRCLDDYPSRLDGQDARLDDHPSRLDEQDARPNEYPSRSDGSQRRPDGQGACLSI
ncbi:hypothetical protein BJ508DRAFT_316303 [Ascobolus immersus RN42]|uniref:Uncharacterized protein n=1 Tax=Ascobolus immersus RN42 TaxID=1160509 RepID=A0A3N4H6Y9_ASCIM|nr:hypothetical protein BJ508DRAFT_316303 [Ascobolus immersus RN42]